MPNEIIFDIPTNQYEVHKMPIKQYTQEGYKITDCYVTFLGQEYQMDLQSGFNGFEKDLYQPQVRQELTILPNYQLQFNGTGQVTIPHSTTLNPVIPFTIELWVKFNQLIDNTAYWLIGKGTATSGSGGYDFVMDISSGQFRFNLVKYYIIDQRVNISPLEVDTWYHFQAVQTSTSVTYYINGNPVGSYTHSGNYQMNTANAYMGKNRTTALSSNMILDEVRFWNIQKSQQEIQQTMNSHLIGNEQGLQGYWNFNNGSGSTVYDLSPNSNDGTKNNGATWCVSEQPIGNAYQLNFDGIDDYIICPGSMLPIGSSPRTISVWIKPDTFVESHHIFFYGTRSDKHAFALDTDGSGYMQFIVWVDDLSFPVPSDGNWIHVALVYDGNITIKAYTNGNLAGSKTLQGVLTTSTSSLYIGSLDGGTGSFDGLISDIRIYDYQLSEQEIQQTMNIPLTGNEQGLVQYYKLNENEGRIAHDYANNNDGIIVGDPIWVDSDQPLGNLFDYEEIESEDREISFRYIDEQLNEYIYNDTITILNISQRNRYYFLDRLNDLQKTNNINIQHNLR